MYVMNLPQHQSAIPKLSVFRCVGIPQFKKSEAMKSITWREFGAAISVGITGIAGHAASIVLPASAAEKKCS